MPSSKQNWIATRLAALLELNSSLHGDLRPASELICATDAGREGELIFRYILSLAGCEHKPFRRLWPSSLTPAALRQAFNRLRPCADYDNLYAAAR